MFLWFKPQNEKKSTELSADVITHKLKIKWEWTKYVTKKFAESLFEQIADQTKQTITIVNPKTLAYVTKYKSEIELIPLDWENSDFEDLLYKYWLTESQKDEVREIRNLRKKERKTRTNWVLKNIIEYVKNK